MNWSGPLHEEADMAWINAITDLLLAGRDPKAIVDVIQTAAAQVILQVQHNSDFSMPHHGYEYTNTLRWFYDKFDHPHRIKLLYVAGSFINQCALWVKHTPGNGDAETGVPSASGRLSAEELLQRVGRRHHRAERIRRRRLGARVPRRRLRPQAPWCAPWRSPR